MDSVCDRRSAVLFQDVGGARVHHHHRRSLNPDTPAAAHDSVLESKSTNSMCMLETTLVIRRYLYFAGVQGPSFAAVAKIHDRSE